MSDHRHEVGEFSATTYVPPGPVGAAFIQSRNPVDALMGPFGSGKTNAVIMRALTQAAAMPVCRDGVRRYRHIFLRDTYQNLWSTMIETWQGWFPRSLGMWQGSEGRRASHELIFDQPDGTRLHFEAVFLALMDDKIQNVLRGIEFTAGTINEADLVSRDVLTYFLARAQQRRFPPLRQLPETAITRNAEGEPEATYHAGITMDYNPPDPDNWLYELFEEEKPEGYRLFKQPSGRGPQGENRQGVSREAYEEMARTNEPWFVARNVDGKYGHSRDGEPVYPEFDDTRHVEADLKPIEGLGLHLCFDQGVRGPAMLVLQQPYDGQVRVLDEVVPGIRLGPTRFGELCRMLLIQRFPRLKILSATADPAGFAGSDQEGGDLAWAETVGAQLGVTVLPAPTNELNVRIDGVKQLLSYFIDGKKPALLISDRCKHLRKGFMSHYRYKVKGTGTGRLLGALPEKNLYSNPHDALQYGVLAIFGLHGVIGGAPGGEGKKGGLPKGRGRPMDDDDEDLAPKSQGPRTDFNVFKI